LAKTSSGRIEKIGAGEGEETGERKMSEHFASDFELATEPSARRGTPDESAQSQSGVDPAWLADDILKAADEDSSELIVERGEVVLLATAVPVVVAALRAYAAARSLIKQEDGA
jgi:hypothetical protein